MMNKERVGVIILTYSQRSSYLEEVLKSLYQQTNSVLIQKIILVSNGSILDLQSLSESLDNGRLVLIDNLENKGSAYGYKKGIQYLCNEKDCEYIWLLDDDNVPSNQCLEELIDTYKKYQYQVEHCLLATASYREKIYPNLESSFLSKEELRELINIKPNMFCGFHISKLYTKLKIKSFKSKKSNKIYNYKYIEINNAPYGGLFFHKTLIQTIGLPNPDFYLYQDDIDFSNRIVNSGGKIILCLEAKVKDIDTLPSQKPIFNTVQYFTWSQEYRAYYAIRNSTFISSQIKNNIIVYTINAFLFIFILVVLSILYGKSDRLILLIRGIRDGLNKQLGITTYEFKS